MDVEMTAEHPRTNDWVDVVLVAGTVILTLATAYIHTTLGGLLFTMNAIGYTVLAAALIVPIPPRFARFRWLVRLALLAFVLATIGGWIMFGARYDVAYFDKAIEVVLIGFLLVSIYRFDGGVAGVIAKLRALPADLSGLVRTGR
jgi:hypothetical protein